MKQFTERDKEMICFIQQFQYEKGYSPTVREISRGLYISSTNTYRRLYKLVEMGYLKITPNTPRSIVINIAI